LAKESLLLHAEDMRHSKNSSVLLSG